MDQVGSRSEQSGISQRLSEQPTHGTEKSHQCHDEGNRKSIQMALVKEGRAEGAVGLGHRPGSHQPWLDCLGEEVCCKTLNTDSRKQDS